MKKLPISLVVVTFNEEKNIERCLRAADFCEELLIIDSGSIDKTIEIAESLGARVMHRDWTGYGDQKNYGTNAASQNWVLCIDADEAVTSELRDSIIEAFVQTPSVDAFEINRHGIYAGQMINHSGWYPEWRIFLYKKSKAEWTGLEPHTTVKYNSEHLGKLRGDLLHYTYADIREHLKKNIASAYASALAMKRTGRRARMTDFFRAPYASFRRYFIQLGFLDGFYGFVIAVLSGVYTLLKYAFLRELYAAEKQRPDEPPRAK
jgi:glycosyltransferase involved in cell wall biosynthesis